MLQFIFGRLADEVFVATGASVFHGAVLVTGTEVRINGVVHLKARVVAMPAVDGE